MIRRSLVIGPSHQLDSKKRLLFLKANWITFYVFKNRTKDFRNTKVQLDSALDSLYHFGVVAAKWRDFISMYSVVVCNI